MPGYPEITDGALADLRQLVRALHAHDDATVPHEHVVQLARDFQIDAGVTIDFAAASALGQPLVVLRCAEPTTPAACLDVLSRREREVAALIADGLSNKQIARRLHLSLATIKDHVHRILTKAGLSNRAAVAAALRGHTAAQPTS